MLTNQSTLNQWLEDASAVFTDVVVTPSHQAQDWLVYAVTATGMKPDGTPTHPYLLLDRQRNKASACGCAARYRRWMGAYYAL